MTAPARDAVSQALAALERQVALEGLRAIDVGCGNGALTRALAARGADALGIEIDAARVEAAQRAGSGAGARFAVGRAEALPAPTDAVDLLVFMHSFHHVPEAVRENALREAARVLTETGRLHFLEPLPHGPMTEVLLTVDDERETRRIAQQMLDTLDGHGFVLRERTEYEIERRFDGVDDYIARMVMVDPQRAAKAASGRAELEAKFAAIAVRDPADGKMVLVQPVASYHFARATG